VTDRNGDGTDGAYLRASSTAYPALIREFVRSLPIRKTTTQETQMRPVILPLTALGLLLLAGCGGGPAADAAAQGSGVSATGSSGKAIQSKLDAQRQELENLTADCMKKQGFQYVPHALLMQNDDQVTRYGGPTSLLQPADEVRAFRQKYGFGAYARLVFPNDPAVALPVMDPGQNPNNAIRNALDPARQQAYDLALHGSDDDGSKTDGKKTAGNSSQGCAGDAAQKVFGNGGQDNTAQKAAAQRAYTEYQTDPAVVAAAQNYADCLRGQGYKVTSTQPGTIETSLFNSAVDTVAKLSPGSVDGAAAKSGLAAEIKAALADLDCRGDYATIARTKYAQAIVDGGGVG
jgi:hypothetical protein